MSDEVTCFSTTSDRFNEFDRNVPAQRSLEDRYVGETRTLAMKVIRPRRTAVRRGAETVVAVPNVHEFAFPFDAEVLAIGRDQFVHVTPPGFGEILFEFVPVETAATTRLHELQSCAGLKFGVDRGEKIGEPVLGEGVFALGILQRFVHGCDGSGSVGACGPGADDECRAGRASDPGGMAEKFGAIHRSDPLTPNGLQRGKQVSMSRSKRKVWAFSRQYSAGSCCLITTGSVPVAKSRSNPS